MDGTICSITNGRYEEAIPIRKNIKKINKLHDLGHNVIYWTARGTSTGFDWRELTEKQFKEWGVRYTELRFNKPEYDYWVDDKILLMGDIL